MPYKDRQRKKEWERRHRLQRLIRRRQLRREEAASQPAVPTAPDPGPGGGPDFPWQLLAGGAVLALYNPALAAGAGGLILTVAAFQKKGWQWWVIGTVIVVFAFFLMSSSERIAEAAQKTHQPERNSKNRS